MVTQQLCRALLAGIPQTDQFEQFQIGSEGIVGIIIVLVLAFLLAQVLERVLQAVADSLETERFRVLIVIPILKVGIYAIAGYIVLGITIDPSPEQILAFSGLFGAAIGLGLKELFTDVLGGLSILFERPYRMGDKISIGDHYGEVVRIGLRSTQIMTLDDSLVTIPNHVFFKESIVNSSAGNAEMLVAFDFHVHIDSDPALAKQIVEEAIITSPYVYVTEDLPVVVRLEDNPYYYTVTGKGYVNDLRNETAFRTDVTERTLMAFDEHGVRQPRARPGVEQARSGPGTDRL